MDDVASGTMSMISIAKTRRCSGLGENGEFSGLKRLGITNPTWSRPSRVLMDWVKKPVVTPKLGKYLLDELSRFMEIIIPPSCLISHDVE